MVQTILRRSSEDHGEASQRLFDSDRVAWACASADRDVSVVEIDLISPDASWYIGWSLPAYVVGVRNAGPNVPDIEGGCGIQGAVWVVDLDSYDGARPDDISDILDLDGEGH